MTECCKIAAETKDLAYRSPISGKQVDKRSQDSELRNVISGTRLHVD